MQLRYYWDDALEDCIVRQTNARFIYAYEYLGAYGISSLACQNDPILQTIHWIVDLSLKTFIHFKLVPKKKGGLLPNGKLMDFFKVEINFFHMEKGCTFIVGNIFLVETKFFLHTFFVVYCVQRVKCTSL
jgi:hypothetical protein